MIALDTPVQQLKGVAPRNGEALARRGVHTVEDLLYHLPFRYEDRLHPKPLTELVAGETASIIAEVRGSALLYTRRQPIFELTVGHGLQSLKAMWFGGTYLKDRFKPGEMVALHGRAEPSRSQGGRFKMVQPQFEVLPTAQGEADPLAHLLEVGRIVPVYESLGGTTNSGARLTSRWARRLLWQVLDQLAQGPALPEVLPLAMLRRFGLPGRLQALRDTHFPAEGTPMDALQEFRTAGQQRLVLEELFYLELGLELKRKRLRERSGIAFETGKAVREALKQVLPFRPTPAQKRVLGEIAGDMRKASPMRRLLQGDVGSGKTIVALQAAVIAVENGAQAVLMAPTEILATQHYLSAKKLLTSGSQTYRLALLTGSLDDGTKRQTRSRILRGDADLIIGTQALIQDKVDFANLGLVIVDEQHRFGVRQRFTLMRKPGAAEPDVLVMTATPIPRTLAMTIYGDLDVSIIDELPPGRTPVTTRRVSQQKAADVWDFVRKQVRLGRQAYVVYPLVEGAQEDHPELDFAEQGRSPEPPPTKTKRPVKGRRKATALPAEDRAPLRSAVEMFEALQQGAFAGLRVGLLHGRMAADEKDAAMRRFQQGDVDVLVATTVIEVGVDVPNATVMVIEHAERFGLAQMHQLRGRVGRGAAKSYCVLMTGERVTEEAEQRLDAMVQTQNGFELAELDLKQRGPGEFFGTRQAGMPDLRVASLVRDRRMLELAKSEAQALAAGQMNDITPAERDMVRTQLKEQWQRRYGLIEA